MTFLDFFDKLFLELAEVMLHYQSQRNIFTLSELNTLIKSVINNSFADAYWVIAEIAESRPNQKGHCYLELVEMQNGQKIAQMKATIWAYRYRGIISKFEDITGESLKPGMKILLLVVVEFHEVYGLSLNIQDIDPTYSLGEMARKKKEVIERLKKEGIFDRNKYLPLPVVPQRIAVISSPTAAGYSDFIDHIENNPYSYKFHHTLFSSIMQGNEAELSITTALREIAKRYNLFDVAVIIRGGGSQIDLSCFDSYAIAREIATFPLPVITGIGHERDDTVTDMVAHTKIKTPTAVAEFVISVARDFEEKIDDLKGRMITRSVQHLTHKSAFLKSCVQSLQTETIAVIKTPISKLKVDDNRLKNAYRMFLNTYDRRLAEHIKNARAYTVYMLSKKLQAINTSEITVKHMDPENVLKRGYSITLLNGKALKDVSHLKNGDIINTILHRGSVTSSVESIQEGREDEKK